MDHVFNLKCLADLYLHRSKHLFCAFIDYRKAFDSDNRLALRQKLLQQNVNGQMLKIIYSMYDGAKSCVRQNHQMSNYFTTMFESGRGRVYHLFFFRYF